MVQDEPDGAQRWLARVSRLVPGSRRREWLREWATEFLASGDRGRWFVARRLAGALEDALRLRVKEMRRAPMIGQEIKHALGRWRRHPGFVAAAITILALGLGANTAVFALVEATMIRPLPYEDGEQLVHFWSVRLEDGSTSNFSWPNFVDIAERSETMAGIAAYHSPSMTLTEGDSARTVETVRVSSDFFDVLGVEPAFGRTFRDGDDDPGAERVVLLDDGFWRDQYGADPEILGRVLILDAEPHTVVGVLPDDFVFARERRAEIWRPLVPDEVEATTRRFSWMHIIGRMEPSVSLERAQAEMDRIAADLAREFPEANEGRGLRLVSMRDQVIGDTGPALTAVYAAVLLVLLITCANLAHLLLARGTRRRGEIAVRRALGASRWQLVRHVLVEVVLLFVVGGVAGAGFATWLLGVVAGTMPDGIMMQAPYLGEIGVSVTVLAYGLGLSLVCGLIFGMMPASRLARGAAGGMGRRGLPRVGSRLLVVSQVAVAVVLLGSTLLLVRSSLRLLEVDPGFDADNLMTARISLPEASYSEAARIVAFNRELVDRVEALPGVVGAAAVDRIPLSGNLATTGVQPPDAGSEDEELVASVHIVTPGYIDVMGMRLLGGRGLRAADGPDARPVVVINELLARELYGDRDPLGLELVAGGTLGLEVVGVVADVKVQTIDRPADPAIYVHTAQVPSRATGLVVRTAAAPLAITAAVRRAVTAIDPALDLYEVGSMREIIESSPAMLTRTIPAILLSGFAVFATVLVALGLFAVVGHEVASRTREIGVRRTLGALPRTIVREVAGGVLTVVGVGVAVGTLGAIGGGRLLGGVLFSIGTTDPLSLLLTAATVLAVSVAACVVPVHRAAAVAPTEALRAE